MSKPSKMKAWMQRLSRRRLENPTGLDDDRLEILRRDLGRLDAVGMALGRRALAYVVDGVDEEVLLALHGVEGGADCLNLASRSGYRHGPEGAKDWALVLAAPLPTLELVLRYGRVLDAARQDAPHDLGQTTHPLPGWLDTLLDECTTARAWRLSREYRHGFDFPALEQLLEAADEPADTALRAALLFEPGNHPSYNISRRYFRRVDGLADAVRRHPHVVRELLHGPAAVCAETLEVLGKHDCVELFLDEIAEHAVGSAKTVREAAEPLVLAHREELLPGLLGRLTDGGAAARRRAAKLLWRVEGAAVAESLRAALAAESSAKNRQVLERLLGQLPADAATPDRIDAPVEGSRSDETPAGENQGDGAPGGDALSATVAAFDPVAEPAAEAPLPESTRQALREYCAAWSISASRQFEREKESSAWRVEPQSLTDEHADRVYELLQTGSLDALAAGVIDRAYFAYDWYGPIRDLLARPELEPIHAVRLLYLLGLVETEKPHVWGLFEYSSRFLDHYRLTHGGNREGEGGLDLRQFAAVLRVVGLDDETVGWDRLTEGLGHRSYRWPPPTVWPFFAEHLELLEQALGVRPLPDWVSKYRVDGIRRSAFEIVSWMPSVPVSLQPALWEAALGTVQAERIPAQVALARLPGLQQQVEAALGDGKQAVRAAAAEWLGRLGAASAAPALGAALGREKQDVVKGALLQALEDVGGDIEPYLDRAALRDEAEAFLRRGLPKSIEWFPFDALPPCRWSDTGDFVDSRILRYFIARAAKLKTPVPGPILRRQAARLALDDRCALGRFVLQAWLAHDESPDSSAAGQKGVLAVAAACGGPDLAPASAHYLKTWYGQRAVQCKVLLDMLAWVDDATDGGQATQLLLSIAHRFRTAGIRKHAEAQAAELAMRRGWSVDELADRTIPTAGFDGSRLELRYGEGGRVFHAVLRDDLTIELRTEDGGTIRSLPKVRSGEDEEAVSAAKKALARARKELKATVRLQTERLYEALCTQRAWRAADWRRFLLEHPIVGRLCRRLVWVAAPTSRSLRPLADGSLSDVDDGPVMLEDTATVRLAHAVNLDDDAVAAWLEHLADYEINPLFVQLGRETFTLPPERAAAESLDEFEGHLLSVFALRAAARRLGYERGPAENRGIYYVYRKAYPTLEIEARLQFSGAMLPEEDDTVALKSLDFLSTAQPAQSGEIVRVALGDLPAVLLSEAWNDLKAIAAEGSGFDPDWEDKVWWN
ncbi:MAG: DUF4132 domain-containing protein [Acidobacteriota bacterium]